MYIHCWVRLLTLPQLQIRNVYKKYVDNRIKIFKCCAGLVLKIKDFIQELQACSVNKKLPDVLL